MGTGLCVGQFSCFEINNLKEERTVLTPGFSIFGPRLLGSVTSGPEVKKNIFFDRECEVKLSLRCSQGDKAREMAWWLKTWTVLAEDPSHVLSTHAGQLTAASISD